jgi:homoserine acetyltransferase
LYDPNQSLNGAGLMSQPLGNGIPSVNGAPNMPAIPDEKLIEALQSPRDRLFVVKIEQDFIDFIKDSRESEYSLPNCNTFYRMLAHRLADYYLLGHVVDTTMTGVKITRTPYCRM